MVRGGWFLGTFQFTFTMFSFLSMRLIVVHLELLQLVLSQGAERRVQRLVGIESARHYVAHSALFRVRGIPPHLLGRVGRGGMAAVQRATARIAAALHETDRPSLLSVCTVSWFGDSECCQDGDVGIWTSGCRWD